MPKIGHTPKRATLAEPHRITARATDSIVSTLQDKALQTIETQETIRLNAAESRKLAEELLAPPRDPTERQLAVKKLYAETITRTP